MRKNQLALLWGFLVLLLASFSISVQAQLADITQPGDPIIPSSNNTPGSEGVANVIDNQPTKYLNFDKLNTGFTVTPGVGDTIVTGLSLTSANDAPERDPASYDLSGSNDGANYVPISSGAVAAFPSRFYKAYIFFPNNTKSFKSYRLIFPTVFNAGSANSMQISEVEFLGVTPGVVNTNPVDTLIRRQPQDTPVLLGSQATFRIGLTGPWKVQWYQSSLPDRARRGRGRWRQVHGHCAEPARRANQR